MGKIKPKTDKSVALVRVGSKRNGVLHDLKAKRIEMMERRYQVACLRRDGFTCEQIAKTLNVSAGAVAADLREHLTIVQKEMTFTVEEERLLQIARLDQLIEKYTPLATQVTHREVIDGRSGQVTIVTDKPDPVYAQLILNIETRRAKLLALDTPEKKGDQVSGIRIYVGVDVDAV